MKLLVFVHYFQDATIQERSSIIPSAEQYEAPRERKEDVKPMSNVKVIFT